MISRILERLEALKEDAYDKWDGGASYSAYIKAIAIVQEVAKEYKAPIRCLTCARYTDTDTIDNICYLCCKGIEDNYVAKEGE